jgi:hypothetical protein
MIDYVFWPVASDTALAEILDAFARGDADVASDVSQ